MFEYEITVRPSNDKAQENGLEPLTFTAICHDEMIGIARRAQQQGRFSQDEGAQLAVGLKLFGEVVLRHRKEEEFAATFEAMHAFMPKLKAMVRGAILPPPANSLIMSGGNESGSYCYFSLVPGCLQCFK